MTPEEQAAADATAAAATKAAADTAAAEKIVADKAAADTAAVDLKARGTKGAGGAGDVKADDALPPESYTFTVPDDAKELVSADDLAYFASVAKASKWTQADAQSELQAHVDRAKAAVTKQAARWMAETTGDSEVGGAQLETTQRHVKSVRDRFLPASEDDGKALRTSMNTSGYGNYRPLVRLLARIGKAMAEDSPALGKGAGGERSTEETLYDHPSSKAS